MFDPRSPERAPARLRGAFSRLAFVAAIAPIAFLPRLALADDGPAPACASYDVALAAAAQAHDKLPGSRLIAFSAEEARRLMDVINAEPPATDYHADVVLVLQLADGSAMAGFVVDGCFVGPARLSAERWAKLRNEAFGAAS